MAGEDAPFEKVEEAVVNRLAWFVGQIMLQWGEIDFMIESFLSHFSQMRRAQVLSQRDFLDATRLIDWLPQAPVEARFKHRLKAFRQVAVALGFSNEELIALDCGLNILRDIEPGRSCLAHGKTTFVYAPATGEVALWNHCYQNRGAGEQKTREAISTKLTWEQLEQMHDDLQPVKTCLAQALAHTSEIMQRAT